jgi:hypothetical protein
MTLSFRNVFIAVTGLTLLTLGTNITMDGSIMTANWLQIIPLALLVRGLGLDMIGFVRLSTRCGNFRELVENSLTRQ